MAIETCGICLEEMREKLVTCTHCQKTCHIKCFAEGVKSDKKFMCRFCNQIMYYFKECPDDLYEYYSGMCTKTLTD